MSNEGPRISFKLDDNMEGQYDFTSSHDPLENNSSFWSEAGFVSELLDLEYYDHPPLNSSSVTVTKESQTSTYPNISKQNFYFDPSSLPDDPFYYAQLEAQYQHLFYVNGSIDAVDDLLPFSMLAPSVKENQIKKKEKDAQPNATECELSKSLVSRQEKACNAGRVAAMSGVKLKTQKQLIKKNKYTEEQAKIYIEAYKQNAGTPEEQVMRGAIHSGKQAGSRGCRLPSDQKLKERYHDDESLVAAFKKAYKRYYKEIQLSPAELKSSKLKRICHTGQNAANAGAKLKTLDELMRKNKYTEEEAKIYIKAFKQNAGTPEEQAIRGATYSGKQAGRLGSRLPSDEKLMNKYNDDESLVEAYKNGYKKNYKEKQPSFAESKSHKLKKIHYRGRNAAKAGTKLKTLEELMRKNKYTEDEAQTYITAFEKYAGTPEEQAIRGATHAGKQAGWKGSRLPSDEKLLNKYNDDESLVEAYKNGHKKTYKEKQPSFAESKSHKLKKIRYRGRNSAKNGRKLKTLKELMKTKHYTEEEAKIYIKAFKQNAGTPEEQVMRGATYSGKRAGRRGSRLPPDETLMNKYNDDESLVAAFKKAYSEKQAEMRGSRLPSDEKLMKKYNNDESLVKAYKQGYLKCKSNRNIKIQSQPKTLQKQGLQPPDNSHEHDLEMSSSVSKPITFAYEQQKSRTTSRKRTSQLQPDNRTYLKNA